MCEPKRKIRFPERNSTSSRVTKPWLTADEKAINLEANKLAVTTHLLRISRAREWRCFPKNHIFCFSFCPFFFRNSFQILRSGSRTQFAENKFKFNKVMVKIKNCWQKFNSPHVFLLTLFFHRCFELSRLIFQLSAILDFLGSEPMYF